MKSLITTLPKLLGLALFLALAPAALASNTWFVDGANGNDGNNCKSLKQACKTIGHAISLASSGDSVRVAPATYTENLTIGISLTVLGANAGTTIIDGGAANTVISIWETTQVILSGLTIRNGYNQYYGGGIINYGTLTINNSTITANSSNYGGGGIENFGTLTINHSTIPGNNLTYQYGSGGAILNSAVLTINHSTISGHNASDGAGIFSGCCGLSSTVTNINDSTITGNSGTWGAAIYITSGTGAINNSTITGNSATDGGGGIMNYGTLTINNATISGNSSAAGGGIFQVTSYGGSTIFQNSIVAENSGGNCLTNPNGIYSNGYNLSSDDTCNFTNSGDMNNTNPQLGTLKNNGGPTQTISELPGSLTIDAGNPSGCTDGNGNPLTTDQRGAPRPGKYKHDKRCDMGAFERQTD
ncbi:MAG: choice-of-anchor Q domain-containing protein [Candidatus Sulfotelmatobacter sp.]